MKNYTVHYETAEDFGTFTVEANSPEDASNAFYMEMICGEGENGKDRTDIKELYITEE